MLAHFVRKAHGRTYARPRVVMGVSAASTPVQRRALKESAQRMCASATSVWSTSRALLTKLTVS